jgi:hypothetical protein
VVQETQLEVQRPPRTQVGPHLRGIEKRRRRKGQIPADC